MLYNQLLTDIVRYLSYICIRKSILLAAYILRIIPVLYQYVYCLITVKEALLRKKLPYNTQTDTSEITKNQK